MALILQNWHKAQTFAESTKWNAEEKPQRRSQGPSIWYFARNSHRLTSTSGILCANWPSEKKKWVNWLGSFYNRKDRRKNQHATHERKLKFLKTVGGNSKSFQISSNPYFSLKKYKRSLCKDSKERKNSCKILYLRICSQYTFRMRILLSVHKTCFLRTKRWRRQTI